MAVHCHFQLFPSNRKHVLCVVELNNKVTQYCHPPVVSYRNFSASSPARHLIPLLSELHFQLYACLSVFLSRRTKSPLLVLGINPSSHCWKAIFYLSPTIHINRSIFPSRIVSSWEWSLSYSCSSFGRLSFLEVRRQSLLVIDCTPIDNVRHKFTEVIHSVCLPRLLLRLPSPSPRRMTECPRRRRMRRRDVHRKSKVNQRHVWIQ